jgi:glucosamine-6-phosphate deaminase
MPIKICITKDFDQLSRVAAHIVVSTLVGELEKKNEVVVGLATGNSPTGMYRHVASAANSGLFDSRRIRSFNLDEYVGLPGENVQQRVLHPESYCYFMVQEFFGYLKKKFIETNVPWGALIDQTTLIRELEANPGDWEYRGTGRGKSIAFRETARSDYLRWVKREVLDGYEEKIKKAGGIDLQVVGVGGCGHVAFHESGIPFEDSSVLLVKLDENTINNAVTDGHFASADESPQYAVSMGAELVYRARNVLLLANGERKMESVTRSLLDDVTPDVPISYGQVFANREENLTYVLDRVAGRDLVAQKEILAEKNIAIEDYTAQTGV